jgi:hypothetical protein
VSVEAAEHENENAKLQVVIGLFCSNIEHQSSVAKCYKTIDMKEGA